MARPRKWRQVCCLPESTQFGPLNKILNDELIIMSVDEYETIRLIDHENLNQEECSERMNIARTTVQGIYFNARKKLADSLVSGKRLLIKGGDYTLCEGGLQICGGNCNRHRFNNRNNNLGGKNENSNSRR